jgi:hypothetical protein
MNPHVLLVAVAAVALLWLYADRPDQPTRCTADFIHWWSTPETGAPRLAYCK